MKFLCPSCDRLVELAAFRVDDGALVVRCSRCSAESTHANQATDSRSRAPDPKPEAAKREPRPEPAVTRAPANVGGAALNVIPLRAGQDEAIRLAAEAARSPDPLAVPDGRCPKCIAPRASNALTCPYCGLVYVNFRPEECNPSEPLAEQWRTVLEHWDDADLHDQFLAAAVARSELPAAGRLYRIRLASAPTDAYALRGRDEVVRLATVASVSLPKSPGSLEISRKWQYIIGGALLLVGFFIFLYLLRYVSPVAP